MFAHISKIFTFLFILNQYSTFCTKMQMKSHKKQRPTKSGIKNAAITRCVGW